MSKHRHNYSKDFQSQKSDDFMNPPVEDEVVDVEEETVVAPTIGIVHNCTRLNIRKRDDVESDVLCVVKEGEELQIIADGGEWLSVCTASGIEGFCMAKFVAVGV